MEVVAYLGIVAVVAAFVYAFVRKAPLSLAVSIAILTVHALLAVTSIQWGEPSLSPGYHDLVLRHLGDWRPDELYMFFTSMFVHQNMPHLVFNMIALILIGTSLEERIGSRAFALIFIFGGLVGSLTFYLLHYLEFFVLLGASGAMSAELGAYARLYPRQKMTLFLPFPLPPIPVIWVAIGFMIISTMMVFAITNIAHEAHIGGLLAGFFIGPLAARLSSKPKKTVGRTDVVALETLATTAELKEILAKINVETLPDIRGAWVERLVERARCPECGGPLRMTRSKVVSECGWRLHLR